MKVFSDTLTQKDSLGRRQTQDQCKCHGHLAKGIRSVKQGGKRNPICHHWESLSYKLAFKPSGIGYLFGLNDI